MGDKIAWNAIKMIFSLFDAISKQVQILIQIYFIYQKRKQLLEKMSNNQQTAFCSNVSFPYF